MKLRLFNILITVLLTACATGGHYAPVSERAQPPGQKIQHHIVAPGESLYAIAWRYGIDFRTLASRNLISSPYTIYPGQKLSLWRQLPPKPLPQLAVNRKNSATAKPSPVRPKSSKPNTAKPSQNKNPTKPTAKSPRSKTKTPAPLAKPKPSSKARAIRWAWPAKGRVFAGFGGKNGLHKGIDIGGKLGEPVLAAAAGRVVYAGNGLRGYGLLLIVKHSEQYLSAYAHNNKLRVKAGDQVKGGQRIADIGSSGADRIKLHFEIRKNGKSVNPLWYLPKR
ncbi:MAG: peptidoglycan DD-metalloendopeptidase family protein [Cellvibrionaceae bacterium]|nr:peptidoglycan DD-metalloendopeptidase family protein [Cellvibrionaceae bacterium]